MDSVKQIAFRKSLLAEILEKLLSLTTRFWEPVIYLFICDSQDLEATLHQKFMRLVKTQKIRLIKFRMTMYLETVINE